MNAGSSIFWTPDLCFGRRELLLVGTGECDVSGMEAQAWYVTAPFPSPAVTSQKALRGGGGGIRAPREEGLAFFY